MLKKRESILEGIQSRKQEEAVYGHYTIHKGNRGMLLGPSAKTPVDDMLFDILNAEETREVKRLSDSMMYIEKSRGRTRPLLSALAKTALSGPVSNVHYIDMKHSLGSDDVSRDLSKRILGLHEKQPTDSLFELILVNAGVSVDDEESYDAKRAKNVTESLMGLPSSVFRVGMVALPGFVQSLDVRESSRQETSELPRLHIQEEPVALAG